MKVVKSISKHRNRQQIHIDDMQFGFMKGKGTTDTTFLQDRCRRSLELKLYFGFVNLEYAFDRLHEK